MTKARPLRPRPLLALLGLLLLSACLRPQYDIPALEDAQTQFEFAARQYSQFNSPYNRPPLTGPVDEDQARRREELYYKTLAAYQTVIDNFPEEDLYARRSRLAIATVHDEYGERAKALDIYRQLIEEYPQDEVIQAKALFRAGIICDERGAHEEAKRYFREATDRFKDHSNPNFRHIAEMSEFAYRRVREK